MLFSNCDGLTDGRRDAQPILRNDIRLFKETLRRQEPPVMNQHPSRLVVHRYFPQPR